MYSYQEKGKNQTLKQHPQIPVIQRVLINDDIDAVIRSIASNPRLTVYSVLRGYNHVFEFAGNEEMSNTLRDKALEYIDQLRQEADEHPDSFILGVDEDRVVITPLKEEFLTSQDIQPPDGELLSSQDIPRPSAFRKSISKAIPVAQDQARCHLVSWETIVTLVIQICNTNISQRLQRADAEKSNTSFFENMSKLWYTVTGLKAPSNSYSKLLFQFLSQSRCHPRKEIAKRIAVELHNQITNLRVGAKGTNSSIHSALDIPVSSTHKNTLPAGTRCITEWKAPDGDFGAGEILTQPIDIVLISDGAVIERLIALLEIEAKYEPVIYTTGDTVQSSDRTDMNDASLLPPGLRIGFKLAKNVYFLFTPS